MFALVPEFLSNVCSRRNEQPTKGFVGSENTARTDSASRAANGKDGFPDELESRGFKTV